MQTEPERHNKPIKDDDKQARMLQSGSGTGDDKNLVLEEVLIENLTQRPRKNDVAEVSSRWPRSSFAPALPSLLHTSHSLASARAPKLQPQRSPTSKCKITCHGNERSVLKAKWDRFFGLKESLSQRAERVELTSDLKDRTSGLRSIYSF